MIVMDNYAYRPFFYLISNAQSIPTQNDYYVILADTVTKLT